MKIYTKVGDGGDTYLFGGKKTSKDDPRVHAYGEVDELNSILGWARTQILHAEVLEKLHAVQNDLFVLGGDLATPADSASEAAKIVPRIGPSHAARLEREIDAFQEKLPPLRTFILPGGSPGGAALHVARAVCRRSERSLAPLLRDKQISPDTQIYLNRLSDFLFVLARTVNQLDGYAETPWVSDAPAR